MNIIKSRAALGGIAACLALGGVTLGTQAAQAQTPLPLTPTLDCIVQTATVDIAYFGYTNTGSTSIAIPSGTTTRYYRVLRTRDSRLTSTLGPTRRSSQLNSTPWSLPPSAGS
jgi:hypothetical protein